MTNRRSRSFPQWTQPAMPKLSKQAIFAAALRFPIFARPVQNPVSTDRQPKDASSDLWSLRNQANLVGVISLIAGSGGFLALATVPAK